jgi:MscS family membrane protein
MSRQRLNYLQLAIPIVTTGLLLATLRAQGVPGQPGDSGAPKPAASNTAQDPLNRESPQSSVYSFLEACHKKDYVRASGYLDRSKLTRSDRSQIAQQLAEGLGQILDRDAQFDVASLSRDPAGDQHDGSSLNREVIDSLTVNHESIPLEIERVTLNSGTAVWLFSSSTVAQIPKVLAMVSESPVERYLPPQLVNWKVLDTAIWRYIVLVLLAVVFAAFSKLFSRLALLLTEPILNRLSPGTNRSVLETLLPPLRLLISVALFRAAMGWVDPSALLRFGLSRALAFCSFFGLAWLCMRLVDLATQRTRAALEARQHTFSYSVLPLADRLLKMIVFLFAAAAVLSDWGYNTKTILTGLGVGGIAIALAAQKTIENFFGGVAIVSDRPVSVGDYCKFGDRAGSVEDIGLRSTRIRTVDRSLIVVPNGEFSTMTLENFNRRDKMLFHLTLNLRRDTTRGQVRTVLNSVSEALCNHSQIEVGPIPVRRRGRNVLVGCGGFCLHSHAEWRRIHEDPTGAPTENHGRCRGCRNKTGRTDSGKYHLFGSRGAASERHGRSVRTIARRHVNCMTRNTGSLLNPHECVS